VNLILFEAAEIDRPVPRTDRRARHVIEVLRRRPGDRFDAGIVNGPRGKATLLQIGPASLELSFEWEAPAPPADPITVIVGLPRPQTARDILRDTTTLGLGALHFVLCAKGDPGYAQSTLWSSGEWRRLVLAGAEQAFTTRLPEVTHGATLAETLARLPANSTRLALDPYEAAGALSSFSLAPERPAVLAIGGERGWADADRVVLRHHGFQLVHLGTRVLRTETACAVALALVRAGLKLL
jgi:RsmE family RNA methyltransferase